jgi:GrpB-like predicted nucleotidyltransferase (UPF0157 family)
MTHQTAPRVLISTADLDECWRFHLARERQRLHPCTAHGRAEVEH